MSELFQYLKTVQQLEVNIWIGHRIRDSWVAYLNQKKKTIGLSKKNIDYEISLLEEEKIHKTAQRNILSQEAYKHIPSPEEPRLDVGIIIVLCLLIGFGIGFFGLLIYLIQHPFAKRKYKKSLRIVNIERAEWIRHQEEAIDTEIEKIEKEIQTLQKRKANDSSDKAIKAECQSFEMNIRVLEKNIQDIETLLLMLYNKNVIHPKYRGLIPISMFCDYFDTGRCDSLTGHEGAYNLYETELRQERIISKLDGIEGRLDGLKANMHYFANSMQSAFNTINQNMVTSADQMNSRMSSLSSQFSGLQQSANNIYKQLEKGVTLTIE